MQAHYLRLLPETSPDPNWREKATDARDESRRTAVRSPRPRSRAARERAMLERM